MAAPSAEATTVTSSEGPVLSLINKRLRALRKKLNRIAQMEESLSQGKPLNKEQEETLRSKPSVIAAIDELEKLRVPLQQAVSQEVERAFNQKLEEKVEKEEVPEAKGKDSVSDLLKLLYFASVFDVKTLMEARDNMLTRTHERNCCLTYDYVTDDDADFEPLKEGDLDVIAKLGGLLVSRPVGSSFSHKNALEICVERAKLWLESSGEEIDPGSGVTYSGLREKLNKIMASDYFTTTPEIKAPVEVAAAAGNYTPFHGSLISPVNEALQVEGSVSEFHQEDEQPHDLMDNKYNDKTGPVEELHQGVQENILENPPEIQARSETTSPDAETDRNPKETSDFNEYQSHRRSLRGGRGGGGRRGYANGRDGLGIGRVSYQNEFYDQPGGYRPRNYNYRGRGGRGISGNYSNYHGHTGNNSSQIASSS